MMPDAIVQMIGATRDLRDEEVVFAVGGEGELLGTLTVSGSAIEWLSRSRQSGRRMSWREFAEVIEEADG
jgi:hypothetical protein